MQRHRVAADRRAGRRFDEERGVVAGGQAELGPALPQPIERPRRIRHVDKLPPRRVRALSAALRLLRTFPSTVEIAPLRHHIDDLHELVPFFLAKLSQQHSHRPGRLTCGTGGRFSGPAGKRT
jgi:hypothetical protein